LRHAALYLIALTASTQTLRVDPVAPRQGDVVDISADAIAASARLLGRTVRLFPAEAGATAGLVPVSVRDKPGETTLELLDNTGRVIASQSITIRDAKFPKQNVRLSGAVAALKPSPGEMETVAALRKTVSEAKFWSRPFARPLPGCMSSPFGVARLHNGKPTGNYHAGVDQRGAAGEPIRAIAAGTVRIAQMFNIHGGTIGLDHGQGVTSTYLHMSRFAVAEGAKVDKADIIGYVGSTGRSTGPHLHWGISVHGVAVNPQRWVQLSPCSAPAKTRYPRKRK
jgi:murein DD-endopeptidase MepM/ murein hydrolase activator NlpD